jgi:RHH-type rel operon transcriptional repressor/antitoxin RelB
MQDMLTVRLSKEMDTRLSALAERTHRAKSFYVKKAIQKFLDEEAEREWAAAAYKDFLDSGAKTISHEEFLTRNPHLKNSHLNDAQESAP